jgi:phosphotransacetylase
MGKTLAPFSQLIAYERRRCAPFRQALSKTDQEAFDRLFEWRKRQVASKRYVARPRRFEAVFMAVLLAHKQRIEAQWSGSLTHTWSEKGRENRRLLLDQSHQGAEDESHLMAMRSHSRPLTFAWI